MNIKVLNESEIDHSTMATIINLCNQAYEEELEPIFNTFNETTHVVGYLESSLVSHALWVTRWLQVGDGPYLRTAYVEMVATDPRYQGQGYASQIMKVLAESIVEYDLGALSPAEIGLYEKIGWILWQGPLFIRLAGRLLTTPEERVMILPLPKTPVLDLRAPLSAEWREGELW